MAYFSSLFRFVTALLLIGFFVLMFGFAAENSEPVTVKYYFLFQWRAPLVWVLLAAAGVGALLSALVFSRWWLRQYGQIRQLRKELKLQAQLARSSGGAPSPVAELPPGTSLEQRPT